MIGDWVFLGSLFFLALSGFLLEAFRIAWTNPPFEVWSPVGWAVGQGFIALGMTPQEASSAHFATWWTHGCVALAFVSAIPFTKAVHMLAGPVNVTVRDGNAGKSLPPIHGAANAEQIGYARITDLSWQHLVSLDACTKCGKCHAACPATASGDPLSPRDLVLDLRELAEGSIGLRAAYGVPPLYGPEVEIGERVRPETIWACTQCMACVEICPVGIEHVPIINELRRRLVDEGETRLHSPVDIRGYPRDGQLVRRTKAQARTLGRDLGFELKDIRREPAELLWFVGDYASFDPRNQNATRALARILRSAGADVGILFDAEKTAGCDVRRAGEEGLWAALAEENVHTISSCKFERIFSSDPHTFHTLRNEYPQHGGDWTVLHHSQLLLELLESGALRPETQLGYRVTYHDPCTLGRYNGVYDAPRRVLAAIGCELVEMPRNRDNSFCCGAGGGRIWMKDSRPPTARRPSEQRIDEAIELEALDYFVVCCPKDVTMYEDAIKTSGHGGQLELRELSELVLESLDLPVEEPAHAATSGMEEQ